MPLVPRRKLSIGEIKQLERRKFYKPRTSYRLLTKQEQAVIKQKQLPI